MVVRLLALVFVLGLGIYGTLCVWRPAKVMHQHQHRWGFPKERERQEPWVRMTGYAILGASLSLALLIVIGMTA